MTRLRRRMVSVCVVIGAAGCIVLIAMQILPSWRFRSAVLHPVPSSVKAIRTDKSWGINEHRYVFRFDISKADLPLILNSRGFKSIGYGRYGNGLLEYGEDSRSTSSFSLYEIHDAKYPPSWFTLDTWRDFQAFLVEKETREYYGVWLLFYREDIGQAYFIEREVWGTWGDTLTHEEQRRKGRNPGG